VSRERIFYFVYDDNRPRGGEKHSYEHVDLLNASGYDAYALHTREGFRLSWFENETRTIHLEAFWNIYDKDRDYIVLPEPLGALAFAAPGRRVIFNKNLYLGYASLGLFRQARYPFDSKNVVGVLSVSDHNLEHLRLAFPGASLFRMYAFIDCDLFDFRPLAQKRKRIVCTTKAPEDVAVLYHTLFARSAAGLNQIADYEWVFLRSLSEADTARLLRESLMVISLSTHEGLPRVVLEAMASGCLVVGYGTGPLKECLPEEYRFQHDDFMGLVRHIEQITEQFPKGLQHWTHITEQARRVAETYTRARQQEHLIAAWQQICASDTH